VAPSGGGTAGDGDEDWAAEARVGRPPSPARGWRSGFEPMHFYHFAGLLSASVLTVNFRQPSHEFTFNVGIDLLF
jgi:hypothetical protein